MLQGGRGKLRLSFKYFSRFLYGLILHDLWRKNMGVLLSYVEPKLKFFTSLVKVETLGAIDYAKKVMPVNR